MGDSSQKEDCDNAAVIVKDSADKEEGEGEEEKEKRPESHCVRGGETLVSIAAMYDVTPSQLAQHNKLGRKQRRYLYVGIGTVPYLKNT